MTATIAAVLVASETAPALAGGKHNDGVYPWYRYGYDFPPPLGARRRPHIL